MLEQDLHAGIDESSCGSDRGGVGGGGGSEEEEYVEGRKGKSLSRSWRSLNRSHSRSPRRRRSSFGCPTPLGGAKSCVSGDVCLIDCKFAIMHALRATRLEM